MQLVVYSKSSSFERHLKTVFSCDMEFRQRLVTPDNDSTAIYLVHAASFQDELIDWLASCRQAGEFTLAVAADKPQVAEMLDCSHLGVQAYFNTYMAGIHYSQMQRLLEHGQSWYPPALLAQALDMARQAIGRPRQDPLQQLTPREREIALAVADGKSNKAVASLHGIAERTVKTHLTHIFEKLQVKDRVALVIYLNQSTGLKTGN